MRIAQIAPLYESVPPKMYGGTERVVSALTEELVRRGHEVTLFASGDSVTTAKLEPMSPQALRLGGARDPHVFQTYMLGEVYRRADEFDIIHSHIDYFTAPLTRMVETPTVTTLHGRLDLEELKILYRAYPDFNVVSISDYQRKPLADIDINWSGTVYNGLPLENFKFQEKPGEYLVFIGRICPEKSPDVAIEIAIKAGIPLKIGAKIDPVDRAYFEEKIKPLLKHPLIEFVGEVNHAEKEALFGGALAYIFPIDWPEPFGLTMIESLACGTPVITRPCGSIPEIMVDGVTGFVRKTVDEMVTAIGEVSTINRWKCREHAINKFSDSAMTEGYLAVYEKIIGAHKRERELTVEVDKIIRGATLPYTFAEDLGTTWVH